MAIWWDPNYAVRQIMRMIPLVGRSASRPRHQVTVGPGDRCGRCPICQKFVRIPPPDPAGKAICPSCGRRIGSLDALS
jgi:uncharacterized paraquat-inducible protein A